MLASLLLLLVVVLPPWPPLEQLLPLFWLLLLAQPAEAAVAEVELLGAALALLLAELLVWNVLPPALWLAFDWLLLEVLLWLWLD